MISIDKINRYILKLIGDQRDIDCQKDFIKFLTKLNDGEFDE